MLESKQVKLSGKYATGENASALVDPDTYELLTREGYRCYFNFKRIRHHDGKRVGYARCTSSKDGQRHSYALHHLALGITTLPKGSVVDHINGNTLDNRRSNLRLSNLTHSARNRTAQRGRSQHRGVRLQGKWYIPVIKYRGLTLYLWRHQRLEDAARLWDFLTLLLDEPSAQRHTNFPAQGYTKQLAKFRQMQGFYTCPGCYD